MALTHLGCPSCGGAVSLQEGQRLVSCRYCGRESLALIPDATARYVVALGVDRAGAAAAAREVLSRPGIPARIRRGGAAVEWTLCYVPHYEVTGTRVGTFLQRESVTPRLPMDQDGEEVSLAPPPWAEQRIERTDTRVVEKEFLRVAPACDVPDLGVERIPLADLRKERGSIRLEPYDLLDLQRRGVVFAPSRAEHLREASAQGPRGPDGDIRVVEERVKLLYYPVWHGRYAHAGRVSTIAVDGVTGAVLAAHAPLDARRPAALFAGAVAGAAFAWGRVLHQLFTPRRGHTPGLDLGAGLDGLVLALLGLLAFCVAGVAWRAMRRGAELTWAGEEGMILARPAGDHPGVLSSLIGSLIAGGPMARGGRP